MLIYLDRNADVIYRKDYPTSEGSVPFKLLSFKSQSSIVWSRSSCFAAQMVPPPFNLRVICTIFPLYSLFHERRLLWNVEWIHEVVNLVDSPPVDIEASPPLPIPHTHLTSCSETPDQIVDDPSWDRVLDSLNSGKQVTRVSKHQYELLPTTRHGQLINDHVNGPSQSAISQIMFNGLANPELVPHSWPR
jgi:hypothetical protein